MVRPVSGFDWFCCVLTDRVSGSVELIVDLRQFEGVPAQLLFLWSVGIAIVATTYLNIHHSTVSTVGTIDLN